MSIFICRVALLHVCSWLEDPFLAFGKRLLNWVPHQHQPSTGWQQAQVFELSPKSACRTSSTRLSKSQVRNSCLVICRLVWISYHFNQISEAPRSNYKRKQKTSEEFDRNSSTYRFEGWNKGVGSENFEDEEFTWICHSANQAKKEASEEEVSEESAPEAPWIDVHSVNKKQSQTVRFSSVRLLIARIWANFEW